LYSIPEDTSSTNWKLLYFRQRNPRKFAVLLAGSGYWGKSSLLHRLRYGNWAELSIADSSPPLPHEVFRKYEIDVDNVNVSIDYWEVGDSPGVWGDFSDEEPINLELHRFDGFVLGYRITDKANFTALQGYIDRIKRFKKVGRFRPIIIVANMLDEERSRVTATSEGMAFGIANNYPFFEISVKSGSNITEPLVTLVRLMLIQQPARTTQQPAPQATLPSPKKNKTRSQFFTKIPLLERSNTGKSFKHKKKKIITYKSHHRNVQTKACKCRQTLKPQHKTAFS